jgi:ferric iron reductase protein FhuF
VNKKKTTDIFNYDFDWVKPKVNKIKNDTKDECCKKYKKKGEKKCKKCPNKKVK